MAISRRGFLAGSAAATLAATIDAEPAAERIKAFCVDFNWRGPVFAPPGHWGDASPEEHVSWYEALGANTIQTFCVSCNGYGWYRGGAVPPQPGLKHDFLTEVVRLGHKRGMRVMGYFCVGANTRWAQEHPGLSYGTPGNTHHIPFTDEYLKYLAGAMRDAIRRTGLDGYMIDWVWNPDKALRAKGWIEAEKKLYAQLTGRAFPAGGVPGAEEMLTYERRAIERCWERMRDARDRANPKCFIWLSCNKLTDPAVANSKLLKECDWVMNEAPSRSLLESVRKMVGPKTRMIQNLVGWADHDAKAFLAEPANRELDCYGFAAPRENSLPLPVEEYLGRPAESFTGRDAFAVNDRNIAVLARFYRGLDINAVVPRKK